MYRLCNPLQPFAAWKRGKEADRATQGLTSSRSLSQALACCCLRLVSKEFLGWLEVGTVCSSMQFGVIWSGGCYLGQLGLLIVRSVELSQSFSCGQLRI